MFVVSAEILETKPDKTDKWLDFYRNSRELIPICPRQPRKPEYE